MADAYWRYGDGRQQAAALPPHMVKRPRTDYGISLFSALSLMRGVHYADLPFIFGVVAVVGLVLLLMYAIFLHCVFALLESVKLGFGV